MVVRVPKSRIEDLMALSGMHIQIGAHSLEIGKGKAKPLSLHTPLYAHCVTTGSEDEITFASDIIQLLDDTN